nr:alkaline phosphatase family protein [Sphingomonas melonis]
MRYLPIVAAAVAIAATPALEARTAKRARTPHNVILVVIDGLRGKIVTPQTAPELVRLRDAGTYFPNSHSVFPTFTTANASSLATGHQLGDTGDFSNTIWTAAPIASAAGSVTPFLENDAVLGEVDTHFGGNYLNETTVLEAARKAGYGTAAIGKLGPALIQDHLARDGMTTIIVDDSTGRPGGIALSPDTVTGMTRAGLPLVAPDRGANGRSGDARTPGTREANRAQQDYFIDVATRVALPSFKARHRPFAMVFWSRDPDGTQHNQGDSLNRLTPGINGPTTFAAIRNADGDLAKLRTALKRLGLDRTTDIIVTSDHGFSTISKQSDTSRAARTRYADVPEGFLPPGFLALDLASALNMPAFDPEAGNAPVTTGAHPSRGNALLGADPSHPDIVVAANGGSDLLYLPGRDPTLARRIVTALLDQDYISGIFVDDRLGSIAGTLPLSSINLKGAALPPRTVDRRHLPLGNDRLRNTDELSGGGGGYDAAARPGHARQLRPRRHPQLHSGDRPRFQTAFRRSGTGQQRGYRTHDDGLATPLPDAAWCADRPGIERSDARGADDPLCPGRAAIRCRREWSRHPAALSGGGRHSLSRRRGFCGPHSRPG